jgi:two-component system chemotaxis sensor kinase CheA
MDDLLREFLAETTDSFDVIDVELIRLEQHPDNPYVLSHIFRQLHTIKGTCGFLGLPRLEALTHAAESLMDSFRNGLPVTAAAVTLILATVHRMKHVLVELERRHEEPAGRDLDLIDELDRMAKQIEEMPRPHRNEEFTAPIQTFSNVTAKLQDSVPKGRMEPIGNAWQKLPRLVCHLARKLRKEIELEMRGGEIEVDRTVLEAIKEPIVHLVRNAADHGLELPHQRRKNGKPGNGTIRLSAHRECGQVVITISDDGLGLDTAKIEAQAIAHGLASKAVLAKMSEAEIHEFIFVPGISTATKVTSISGRGIGMDVVRHNIDAVGGTILIESRPGESATIVIKVPAALPIAPAVIVESCGIASEIQKPAEASFAHDAVAA